MMVPGIFTALPNFLLIKNLGLLNTLLGLVLPYLFMSPFAIFFLRQFFLNMSREVEEGSDARRRQTPADLFPDRPPQRCSAPRHPRAADLHWPTERILLASPGRQPRRPRVLTVGLGVFKAQAPQGAPDWSGLMAATLVSALPILLLFIAFGKKIVNSIGFSGIK